MTLAQSLYESLYECFNPTFRPSVSLEMKPRQVKLTAEDYRNMRQAIIEECDTWGNRFDLDYETDTFTLNLKGEITVDLTDTFGDGYTTPKETIEDVQINILTYECRDADYRLTTCDFDHKKL